MSVTQRAVVHGTLLNLVQFRNIFTCSVTEVGGDTADILWEAYISNFYSAVGSIVGDSFYVNGFDEEQLVGHQWEHIGFNPYSMNGLGSTDVSPNAVALVFIGVGAGLRQIGKKFISGLAENKTTGNILASTALTAAATTLAAYVTPFTGLGGGTIEPGIVDKGWNFHSFVGGFVSSYLGSQRRRKPGIGI